MRTSVRALRYRTAWRDLLHPLPVCARQDQWLRRDTVEINEAILRQPYYTLKSYSQSAYVDKPAMFANAALGADEHAERGPQSSSYGMLQTLRAPRHACTPRRLQELRDELRLPARAGPEVRAAHYGAVSYQDEYGARLRPRYVESWDTVPPHQPSRDAT